MKNTKKALNQGFSLIEMLVVIAVIGIIAAIAVPQIGNINDRAKEGRAKRNAQNIASIFASAQAAGLDFGSDAAGTPVTDKNTVIGNVITGDVVADQDSAFVGAFFGAPGVQVSLATTGDPGAHQFLNFANGVLQYSSTAIAGGGAVTN